MGLVVWVFTVHTFYGGSLPLSSSSGTYFLATYSESPISITSIPTVTTSSKPNQQLSVTTITRIVVEQHLLNLLVLALTGSSDITCAGMEACGNLEGF